MPGSAARIQQEGRFGTWPSPLSAAEAAAAALRLSQPQLDGEHVYWLEGRPAEGGRQTVMRARLGAGAAAEEVTPGRNARSRVHEYGGGDYRVRGGCVVAADPDGGAFLAGREAGPLASARSGARYGDFVFSPDGRWIVAVEEEHGEGEPANRLVALAPHGRRADRARRRARLRGVSVLRAGRRPPRLRELGAPRHAVGRDHAARAALRPERTGGRGARRGRRRRGVDLPAGLLAGRRADLRLRPERLVEPLAGAGRRAARALPARGGARPPALGARHDDLGPRGRGRDLVQRARGGPRSAVSPGARDGPPRGAAAALRRRRGPDRGGRARGLRRPRAAPRADGLRARPRDAHAARDPRGVPPRARGRRRRDSRGRRVRERGGAPRARVPLPTRERRLARAGRRAAAAPGAGATAAPPAAPRRRSARCSSTGPRAASR